MVGCTQSRLAGIPTSWTLVMRAHNGDDTLATSARFRLLDQYSQAAWRYLLGITRNQATAEDLFQDFVVRMLQGSFGKVTPAKGRFRDYLKTALINLVNDYFRNRSTHVGIHDQIMAQPIENADQNHDFDVRWRQELLRRTWQQLQQRHPLMYDVLKTHVNDPESSTSEKAEQIERLLSAPFTANRFRVTLHRAREKFSRMLEREVAATLESPGEDQLFDELKQLRLLSYCRHRRSGQGGGKEATAP